MRSSSQRYGQTVLAALIVATIGAHEGRAANQDSVFLGNTAAMTGGAVTAVIRDGEAAWYNPAGLGGVRRNSIDISASAFTLQFRNTPSYYRTVLPDKVLDLDTETVKFQSIASALVYTRRFSEGTWGAFGIFVPLQEEFDLAEMQETDGTVDFNGDLLPYSFRQRAEESLVSQAYLIGPSIGSEIADGLRIGGSFFIMYGSASSRAHAWRAYELESPGGTSSGFEIQNTTEDATYMGLTGVFGVQYSPKPDVHLGLTARAPIFRIVQWGERTTLLQQSQAGPLFVPGTEFEPSNTSGFEVEDFSSWGFDMVRPARVQLGAAFDIDGAWVSIEGDLAHPAEATDATPEFDWTWNLRAGAMVPLTEKLSLGLGFFTDHAPTKPVRANSGGGEHIDYYGGTIGFELEKEYNVTDDPDGSTLTFSTTIAARYAAGVGYTTGYTGFPLNPEMDFSRRVGVTYHEVGVHIGSGLYF